MLLGLVNKFNLALEIHTLNTEMILQLLSLYQMWSHLFYILIWAKKRLWMRKANAWREEKQEWLKATYTWSLLWLNLIFDIHQPYSWIVDIDVVGKIFLFLNRKQNGNSLDSEVVLRHWFYNQAKHQNCDDEQATSASYDFQIGQVWNMLNIQSTFLYWINVQIRSIYSLILRWLLVHDSFCYWKSQLFGLNILK